MPNITGLLTFGLFGVLLLTGMVLLALRVGTVQVSINPDSFPTPVPTHTPAATHTPVPTPHPTPGAGDAVVRLAVSETTTLAVGDLTATRHHINERRLIMPHCRSQVAGEETDAYWWILLPTDQELRHFIVDGGDAIGTLHQTNPLPLEGTDYNAYRTNEFRCGDTVRTGFGGRVVTVAYEGAP